MYVTHILLTYASRVGLENLRLGIPILMFSWGLVTAAHALINDKAGYLTG